MRPRVDVAGIGEKPIVAVDERVIEAADARRDDSGACRHRFKGDGAKRFWPLRGDSDDVGPTELLVDLS